MVLLIMGAVAVGLVTGVVGTNLYLKNIGAIKSLDERVQAEYDNIETGLICPDLFPRDGAEAIAKRIEIAKLDNAKRAPLDREAARG